MTITIHIHGTACDWRLLKCITLMKGSGFILIPVLVPDLGQLVFMLDACSSVPGRVIGNDLCVEAILGHESSLIISISIPRATTTPTTTTTTFALTLTHGEEFQIHSSVNCHFSVEFSQSQAHSPTHSLTFVRRRGG